MKKLLSICLTMTIVLCLAACSKTPQQLTIPDPGTSGGYEIQTDTIYCKTVIDGGCKYTRCELLNSDQIIEFYATATELTILHHLDGTTTYYTESYPTAQIYPHPLESTFDELRELEFRYLRSDADCSVYEAVQTVQTVEEVQIDYTLYNIEMDWTDGEHYVFRYYVYADGTTLISAEAPDEINPLITADTAWKIDLDKQCLTNADTSKQVAFSVESTQTGKALSPNGSSTSISETQTHIYIYANSINNEIVKIQYEDGSDITVLNTANIEKIEITSNMTEMDSEALQTVMMLIYALESLV